jgi:hypothetical protein
MLAAIKPDQKPATGVSKSRSAIGCQPTISVI